MSITGGMGVVMYGNSLLRCNSPLYVSSKIHLLSPVSSRGDIVSKIEGLDGTVEEEEDEELLSLPLFSAAGLLGLRGPPLSLRVGEDPSMSKQTHDGG